MKKSLAIILALCLLLTPFTLAHSGRTDKDGGHWMRDDNGDQIPGSYHYHNGGGSSSESTPKPAATPKPTNTPKPTAIPKPSA